jgi:hypothetical protein
MKLCHGTSERNIPRILKYGLQPRRRAESQWSKCPSHPLRVYLTNAYAFYFALQSAKKGEGLAVIEVDVDEENLCPDEDFAGQVTKGGELCGNVKLSTDLIVRTIQLRDLFDSYPEDKIVELAMDSLEYIGNASHFGPVDASRITRIAVVPADRAGEIIACEFDPCISIPNYRYCGHTYRDFQQSLFERFPYEIASASRDCKVEKSASNGRSRRRNGRVLPAK